MEILSREFGRSTSHQYGGELTRTTPLDKITYQLDVVTERGATFRVSILSRYGSGKPEVSWLAVRPSWPLGVLCSTRKLARERIGS